MKSGDEEERAFQQLRRKVREARVLCPTVESLLQSVQFTGRLSVNCPEWTHLEIRL